MKHKIAMAAAAGAKPATEAAVTSPTVVSYTDLVDFCKTYTIDASCLQDCFNAYKIAEQDWGRKHKLDEFSQHTFKAKHVEAFAAHGKALNEALRIALPDLSVTHEVSDKMVRWSVNSGTEHLEAVESIGTGTDGYVYVTKKHAIKTPILHSAMDEIDLSEQDDVRRWQYGIASFHNLREAIKLYIAHKRDPGLFVELVAFGKTMREGVAFVCQVQRRAAYCVNAQVHRRRPKCAAIANKAVLDAMDRSASLGVIHNDAKRANVAIEVPFPEGRLPRVQLIDLGNSCVTLTSDAGRTLILTLNASDVDDVKM